MEGSDELEVVAHWKDPEIEMGPHLMVTLIVLLPGKARCLAIVYFGCRPRRSRCTRSCLTVVGRTLQKVKDVRVVFAEDESSL